MDLIHTILLLVAQTVFYMAVLVACLKLAANKHRDKIRSIADQINKIRMGHNAEDQTPDDSEGIRRKLMERISSLQARLQMLQGIEIKYDDLKIKYKNLQDKSATESQSTGKKTIQVGTTVDRSGGVDPAYMSFLQKKSLLSDFNSGNDKISGENERVQEKLKDQRDTIHELRSTLRSLQFTTEVSSIKGQYKDKALERLQNLENNIEDSLRNSNDFEKTIAKLRAELAKARAIADSHGITLDGKKTTNGSGGQTVFEIVRNKNNDEGNEADIDPFVREAVANYSALKKEVGELRQSTTAQRQAIFSLEGDIIALRKELQLDQLDADEKFEKEKQLEKLERLLAETEGCVNILESEVQYLQEKLETVSDTSSLQKQLKDPAMVDSAEKQLKDSKASLERAAEVRKNLYKLLELSNEKMTTEVLERIAKIVFDCLSPLNLQMLLKVKSELGSLDVCNNRKAFQIVTEELNEKIGAGRENISVSSDYIFVTYTHVGVCVKQSSDAKNSLGGLEQTLSFVLLVCNTVLSGVEARFLAVKTQNAVGRLVDGVQKNISQMSVQSKYQADEARNILKGFLSELNASLNTMNITENQSKYFDEMIDQTKERMEVLFATELVVDSAFSELVKKLKNSKSLLKDV